MGKTVTIPTSVNDPQRDFVRTGCCLLVDFTVSGTFQLKLLLGATEIFLFSTHVDATEYGPFKTPFFGLTFSWHFDPDTDADGFDGILTIDATSPCDEKPEPGEDCDDDNITAMLKSHTRK